MSKSAAIRLLSVSLAQETDFVLARQRAKSIAEIVGFEAQDQTRIATAVSEIARNAFEYAVGGRVDFHFERGEPAALRIVVSDAGGGIRDLDAVLDGSYKSTSGMGVGIIGSRRLMDTLEVESAASGTMVTMTKHLPQRIEAPSAAAVAERLAALASQDLSSAVHTQNHEVLRLLNELRDRERELQQLNQELKETNRGVMVLYSELEDRALELQHASEMKTRFISGITHELRTPLNSIVSLTGLLIARIDGELSTEQEKQVLFIQRSAENLTEMVNDLLDLAKIEAGKLSVKIAQFTVGDVFAALRGMFRPLATNENVQLVYAEGGLGGLALSTDEGKLGQVLRNFVSNALKFTERGTVTVSAELVGRQGIRFSVQDTGVGIAREDQEMVWQEWGQVERDQRPRHRGSGLGLPLSRQLAGLLGGTTGLESKPGVGSRFFVELPSAVASPPPARAVPEAASSRSVLLVDEDEVARYILRRSLAGLTAARVVEAGSGDEARALLAAEAPSLLLMNLELPDGSGLELARELRARGETRSLPMILVGARIPASEERDSMQKLDIEYISREAGDADDRRVALERALLNVGFSDGHEAANS